MNKKVVKFVQHPYLSIIAGVAIIITAMIDLQDESGLSGAHGLLLFGIFHTFKFIIELMEGINIFTGGVKKKNLLPKFLERSIHNFTFHIIIAGALLIIGSVEIYEQVVKVEESKQIWHYGVIGVALMHITSTFAKFSSAFAFAYEAGEEGHKHWLVALGERIHFPRLEIFLGIFVVLVCLLEGVLYRSSAVELGVHHGMFVYAFTRISQVLASLAVPIHLINNVQNHKNPH